MSVMSQLAEQINIKAVDRDADLPYPNIYWCTVSHVSHGEFNTYLAGEFTESARAKVVRWCRESHGFAPYRSNSKLLMRRLRLGDIIENPAAYDVARKHAVDAGERDIVAALDLFPDFVRARCGIHGVQPVASASDSLWQRFTHELDLFSRRHG